MTARAKDSNGGRRHESGPAMMEGMRHQPALEPVGEGPATGLPVAARRAEAWCLMLDGTAGGHRGRLAAGRRRPLEAARILMIGCSTAYATLAAI